MLTEQEFNSIKDKTYEKYLLDLVIKYSSGATGSWTNPKTIRI